jgi:hypothetical protein
MRKITFLGSVVLVFGCSGSGDSKTLAASQGQAQLADASSQSGSSSGFPVVGPGPTPVESKARQQADEAGTCKAPAPFEAYNGNLPLVLARYGDGGLYYAEDGGLEEAQGCAQTVPEILCGYNPDGGEVCGDTCGPSTYTLLCGQPPESSFGCTLVNIPGPPQAHYCCPCPPQ